MTTAVNIFVRQTVRQGGIPFEITTRTDPLYSENNMKSLRKSIEEANSSKYVSETMEELMVMEK